jgi:hypothetical protein
MDGSPYKSEFLTPYAALGLNPPEVGTFRKDRDMTRICKMCGAGFPARTNYKCCSDMCSKANERQRMKAWQLGHPERMNEIRRQFIERLTPGDG